MEKMQMDLIEDLYNNGWVELGNLADILEHCAISFDDFVIFYASHCSDKYGYKELSKIEETLGVSL